MAGATTTAAAAGAAPARTLELRRGEQLERQLARLKKVAKGFDAVFAGTMLKQLLAPVFGEGIGGSGPGASIVQGLVEQNLSDAISRGGGLGVGRLVERQLRPRIEAQMRQSNQGKSGAGDGATHVQEDGR
jgi:Rod binding domain-containing protein